MPFDGAGNFTPSAADNPVVALTFIQAPKFNNTINDIATGLSSVITKNGQTVITANLPMGGFRHTGVANAAARTDYAAAGQVQDGSFIWAGTAGGTADALTLTMSPSILAYAAGQSFVFKSGAGANTGAATVAVSGLAAKAIQNDGSALVAGNIAASRWHRITYDGAAFQLERLNTLDLLSGLLAGTNAWAGVNTFIDTNLQIIGSADATKKLRFEADGITAGATRTLSAFDRDGFVQLSEDSWLYNATLVASAAANALTVALKTKAGTDPSATDPVYVGFRNVLLGTGDYTVLKVVAATSVVVSSGSTLGTVSAQPNRIYVTGHNDAGTFRLGVYNSWDDTNKGLLGLDESLPYSSTAEGGVGAADSAQVIYTGTAVAAKALVLLGYLESTQATAGTWVTQPSKVQLLSVGARRTGAVIQTKFKSDGAVATGSTATPDDDTIPQIGEGNEFISLAVTPTSAINLLTVEAQLYLANPSGGNGIMIAALHREADANALVATRSRETDASPSLEETYQLSYTQVAASLSSTTFRVRAGNPAGTQVTFNGAAGVRKLGGVMNSYMRIEEIFV